MLRKFWRTVIKRHFVDEAPDEITACLDCNVIECDQNKYDSCPVRLAYLAEAKQNAAASCPPPSRVEEGCTSARC